MHSCIYEYDTTLFPCLKDVKDAHFCRKMSTFRRFFWVDLRTEMKYIISIEELNSEQEFFFGFGKIRMLCG